MQLRLPPTKIKVTNTKISSLSRCQSLIYPFGKDFFPVIIDCWHFSGILLKILENNNIILLKKAIGEFVGKKSYRTLFCFSIYPIWAVERLANRCLSRDFSMGSMPGVRSMFCMRVLWEIQAMWNESLGKPLIRYFWLWG